MTVVRAEITIILTGIVVIGGVLILIGYFLYRVVAAKTQILSNYTIRPPSLLRAPAAVSYHCDVLVGRQPARPLPDAELTFTLTTGCASIDGASSKKVKTDAAGNAPITLTPVATGADELRLHLEVGSKSGDEAPIRFEVLKQ